MQYLRDLQFDRDLNMEIFQYHDYISLLRDYFERCQEFDKQYSYRHFAKRLGMKSPGYVQSLLSGKRQITDKTLGNLTQIMGLREKHQEYFELLVRIARMEPKDALYPEYQRRLERIRSQMIHPKTLDEVQAQCVSSWLHWVIREMTLLRGATPNVQWFKKCLGLQHLPISAGVINRCIDELKTAGLLVEENHELIAPDPLLSFEDEQISELLKFYHKEAMEQGILGLQTDAKQREYGSVLVATTSEKFHQLKEKLKNDRRDALKMLHTEPGQATVLVSFSFQLFPVAKSFDEYETSHS